MKKKKNLEREPGKKEEKLGKKMRMSEIQSNMKQIKGEMCV